MLKDRKFCHVKSELKDNVKLDKWSKVIDTSQGVPDNITRARRREPAIYRAAWGPGAAELWGFTLW